MKNKNFGKKYYLGLSIGKDSVGYAVTDTGYHILKFRGEPMWGVNLFDAVAEASERRFFREERRRLDRRQQRVHLTEQLFAKVIAKVDGNSFSGRTD